MAAPAEAMAVSPAEGLLPAAQHPEKERPEAALSKFHCEVCDKVLLSDSSKVSHLNGAKHARMVRAKEILEKLKEQGKQIPDTTDMNCVFRCEICDDTILTSTHCMALHINGSKHTNNAKAAAKRLSCPDGLVLVPTAERAEVLRKALDAAVAAKATKRASDETVKGTPTAPADAAAAGETAAADQGAAQPGEPAKKAPRVVKTFQCTTCNVSLNSEEQRDQHMNSKKHSQRLMGIPPQNPGLGFRKGRGGGFYRGGGGSAPFSGASPRGASTPRGGRGGPFAARGSPYTPRGSPYTPRGGPHTPRGGPHTPQGGPLTPRGGPHTPQGGPLTPRGGPHTPRGSRGGRGGRGSYSSGYPSGQYNTPSEKSADWWWVPPSDAQNTGYGGQTMAQGDTAPSNGQAGAGYGSQGSYGGAQINNGAGYGSQSGAGYGSPGGTAYGSQSGAGYGSQGGTAYGSQGGAGFDSQSSYSGNPGGSVAGYGSLSNAAFGSQSSPGVGSVFNGRGALRGTPFSGAQSATPYPSSPAFSTLPPTPQ